jgi:hypothetical protein
MEEAMPPGTLEEHSLWYHYKTTVWLEESPEAAVVHNIMRTLRAVHNLELAYVSAPITTGKRFYELLLAAQHPRGVDTDQVRAEAMAENHVRGGGFWADVARRHPCAVLYPADLIPARQRWSQAHFQALWLSIIAEMAKEVHMIEDWHFSNGCAEEFVHVFQLRLGLPRHETLTFRNFQEETRYRERLRSIQCLDHRGDPLTIADGLRLFDESIAWLTERHLDAGPLTRSRAWLAWTRDQIEAGFYQ